MHLYEYVSRYKSSKSSRARQDYILKWSHGDSFYFGDNIIISVMCEQGYIIQKLSLTTRTSHRAVPRLE